MDKYSITKTFNISVGHRLSKHTGRCRYVHGHNLRIDVTMAYHRLDSKKDMVCDFSSLKQLVEGVIVQQWDHALILNEEDPLVDILKMNTKNMVRLFLVDGDPTAEVLAERLHKQLNAILGLDLKNEIPTKHYIDKVTIWETPTSCATYEYV